MSTINLDKIAAQNAQEIMTVTKLKVGKKKQSIEAKTVDTLATKALGVLQEQGIYSLMLFLLSRSGEKNILKELDAEKVCACYITKTLLNILVLSPFESWGYGLQEAIVWNQINNKKKIILDTLSKDGKLLDNLDHLFLIKNLYEQVLIYARYAAKAEAVAMDEENKSGGQTP